VVKRQGNHGCPPWPDKPCPYCGNTITDLLAEMAPDAQQVTPDFNALVGRRPGGAITCAYCQEAIEYALNGEDLVQSSRIPLRYSRQKTEDRARGYGQVFLNKVDATPEEWVADDKAMVGALRGYKYAEDP
jgi:hypothetical protein